MLWTFAVMPSHYGSPTGSAWRISRRIGPRFWTVLDIYCQPSLVPSTGRTLALALAEGVPTIATQVKGLRGLIDHGSTGLVVPPGSPESLAAAIIDLLENPDQAALMGSRGQEATDHRFDVEIEADLLASLYRRHAALPENQGPR